MRISDWSSDVCSSDLSRFGPTGNFENWWTDADSEGFAARTGKLVDQFNAYTTDAGGEVNGKLTLGENIADLGGLAKAYDAMKQATEGEPDQMTDGLTADQTFFPTWASLVRTTFPHSELSVDLNPAPHHPA